MATSDEDVYPSARDALTNKRAWVNAYCATKYLTWHIAFLLLGVIFAAIAAVAVPIIVGWHVASAWLEARRSGDEEESSDVDGLELEEPPGFRDRAEAVLETAKEKPVARRVYNECPVTLVRPPRWFDNVATLFRRKLAFLEDPYDVAVCPECGGERTYDVEGKVGQLCFDCHAAEYVVIECEPEELQI